MISKLQTKLLTKLLNIEKIKVIFHSHYGEIGIILHLESETKKGICPYCGNQNHKLHQNHKYLVKDLSLMGQPAYLEVKRRQFKCDSYRKLLVKN